MKRNVIQLHNTDPETFKLEIVSEITSKIEEMKNSLRPNSSTWISRKQASDLLGVSLVTISDWSKKGILKAYRIGNRVRFKLHEIEEVLNNSRDESPI